MPPSVPPAPSRAHKAVAPERHRSASGQPRSTARGLTWWLTLGYTVFVVYGSLVPLRFHPRPLEEAWNDFRRIPYLELGIGSRADWVANILLFVPLAFLWLGVLWPKRGSIARALVSAFVLAACAGLSVAIEFTQIFFPPRTVSLNDIFAEGTGALVGALLWWSVGSRVWEWLDGWSRAHTPTGATQRLLYAYLFLLFGYSVLPLDLTISPVEMYHKWHDGKILLVPFSATYASGAERAYALLVDVAIWIPAAFLWKLSSSRSARTIVLYVLGCAALIEVLQLFVYSRVTSTTDVITAGCGAAIGVIAAQWLRPGPVARGAAAPSASFGDRHFALLWLLALVGWAGVLIAVFWYPFDFRTDWGFVHERVAQLKRVPFEAYYFGTEFRAVTEVFHKTGFFFPLGALLAVGAARVRRRFAIPAVLLDGASALLIAGAAAGIEIGQVFLPGKVADSTDWLLETAGALVGYFCLRLLIPVWRSARSEAAPRSLVRRESFD
jgi:glycopeptide antibiotics resistance protein